MTACQLYNWNDDICFSRGDAGMKIVPLDTNFEVLFWKHVNQDIPHYYFFAFDWKHNREKTKILLALENEEIDGMMLVYDARIAQLRGSSTAAEALLQRLDLENVELQSQEEHQQLVLKKYKPTLRQSHAMMLMLLRKGEETVHMEHPTVPLDVSDSEKIAAIMKDADPEYWGNVTGQGIMEGMGRGALGLE